MKAVALRLAPKRVEIEAGDVEIAQGRRMVQRVQSPERPALNVPSHFSTSTLPKKFLKSLVPEAPNHSASVTSCITPVNEYVTEKAQASI